MDSGNWARLPSEVLELIAPLLHEHLPVARFACKYWASELPHGTVHIRVTGAGPPNWGTRLFSGVRELFWYNPQILHCAPWRSLRTLALLNASDTDAALRLLFDASPPLHYLDVHNTNVTDAGLVGASPSLTHVNLNSCIGITDAALASLGHVETLLLGSCNGLDGSGLGQLRSVTSLTVSSPQISNWEGLATIAGLTSLNAIGASRAGLRSLGQNLASFSSLAELKLGGLPLNVLVELQHAPSLRTLSLSYIQVWDASISNLRNLETLIMIACDYVVIEGLAPLTNLRFMSLRQCTGVDDDGLLHLASLPSMLSLTIQPRCDGISDDVVALVRQVHPELRLNV